MLFGLLTGNCGLLRLLFGGLGLAAQRVWLLFCGFGLLGCCLVDLGLLSNISGCCLVAVDFLGAVWWAWACCPTDLVGLSLLYKVL